SQTVSGSLDLLWDARPSQLASSEVLPPRAIVKVGASKAVWTLAASGSRLREVGLFGNRRWIQIMIPEHSARFGFAIGSEAPHATRTMMLAELRRLLEACPRDAGPEEYRAAVVE